MHDYAGRTIVVFMNDSKKGRTGGETRTIETMKRIKNADVVFVASKLGEQLCRQSSVKCTFRTTTREQEMGNEILVYAKRAIRASLMRVPSGKDTLLYSASNLFQDILPAFCAKLRNRQAKWWVCSYHLVPHPSTRPGGGSLSNTISYLTHRLSLRLWSSRVDLVETETPIGKSELIESCHISPQRILAVESGINPEIIDGTDWVGEKVYEACFLARIHRSKGIFDLIEAWAHVCKHRGNAKLAIAGWGTEEVVSSLKEQISKSGLDANVAILGYLSEQEKYRLFKSSRLYVLPSYEEGIPITFYEAMYCGLPVITYYLPTYETIRERIGAVALGDKCALAREIIETLDNEERASRLVELGRDFASRHTWDDVANDIISEIDRLMHWKGY